MIGFMPNEPSLSHQPASGGGGGGQQEQRPLEWSLNDDDLAARIGLHDKRGSNK